MPRTARDHVASATTIRPLQSTAITAGYPPERTPGRLRGRPGKKLPSAPRFAPIRLDGVDGIGHGPAPFTAAFEIAFPDGSVLRAARDADYIALEGLVRYLRRRGD